MMVAAPTNTLEHRLICFDFGNTFQFGGAYVEAVDIALRLLDIRAENIGGAETE